MSQHQLLWSAHYPSLFMRNFVHRETLSIVWTIVIEINTSPKVFFLTKNNNKNTFRQTGKLDAISEDTDDWVWTSLFGVWKISSLWTFFPKVYPLQYLTLFTTPRPDLNFFSIFIEFFSIEGPPLNPSIPHCRDVRGVSGGPLIGALWCRHTSASQTAVRLSFAEIPRILKRDKRLRKKSSQKWQLQTKVVAILVSWDISTQYLLPILSLCKYRVAICQFSLIAMTWFEGVIFELISYEWRLVAFLGKLLCWLFVVCDHDIRGLK